jgi:hypothetical protein
LHKQLLLGTEGFSFSGKYLRSESVPADDFATMALLLGAPLGALLLIIGFAVMNARKMTLKKRFNTLKAITGQSKASIESVVGPANSVSKLPDGKELHTWTDHTGHITLQFNGDICECITAQTAEEECGA